jgi:hypothetical protein
VLYASGSGDAGWLKSIDPISLGLAKLSAERAGGNHCHILFRVLGSRMVARHARAACELEATAGRIESADGAYDAATPSDNFAAAQ